MTLLPDFLLSGLVNYGAPLFGLALIFGALGIPIPTSLMVIAAGAFSRLGLLNPVPAGLLGLLGAVIGDSISFAIGRWGGNWISRRFGHSSAWRSAQTGFVRSSGMAIFLSRFLFTAFAIPVNLLAGSSYSFRQFLLYDIAGEIVWILAYGGLGYAFGGEWELVGQFLSDFGGLTLGIAILGGAAYFLFHQNK